MNFSPTFQHISLYVSNLEQTINHYDQFFGRPPTKIRPGYAKYEMADTGLLISFIEQPERVQANFGHLGFVLDSAIELKNQLTHYQTLGLVDQVEMGVNCCYAAQDKFWVKDPDGHQWEIYYRHDDVEFNDPAYEISHPAPAESAPAIDKETCGCGVSSSCC